MSVRTLTVYSRRGCHACEDMIAELEFMHELQGFELNVTDVDSDPALIEQYGLHVPVLLLGGDEVCRHALDIDQLRARLARLG